MLSNTASLPDWLASPLKHQPMLFVGCEIPDWFLLFLLRMLSNTRLSFERKQFFFVSSSSYVSSLSSFFATYCHKALVQQLELEMGPAAFLAELRKRWEQHLAGAPLGADVVRGPLRRASRLASSVFAPPAVESGAVFLVQVFAHLPEHEMQVASLAREFDEAARRRGTVRLESGVFVGERLAFELLLPGLLVDEPVQSMVWIESPQSVQFEVSVPQDFPPRSVAH